jgi:hypothetical protein
MTREEWDRLDIRAKLITIFALQMRIEMKLDRARNDKAVFGKSQDAAPATDED